MRRVGVSVVAFGGVAYVLVFAAKVANAANADTSGTTAHVDPQLEAVNFQAGPPEPIVSDYVELTTLLLLFIVGAPLNLAAYAQIGERPAYTRLDILKRHLNYSDLLVLFVYVPSRACWLITYDWRGGDFLCKFVKFMHTFTFQISSNVIVCIAMDRLLTVISASHHNPERAHHRMRLFLAIAWITALIISAPQFAIWRNYLAFEHLQWSQCMQIWEILRAEAYLKNASHSTQMQEMVREENVYMIVHMLLIFWIPATIILLCYVIVSCWVYFNSRPSLFIAAECAAVEAAVAAQRVRAHTVSYQPIVNMNGYHNVGGRYAAATTTTVVANGNGNGVHHQKKKKLKKLRSDPAGDMHFARNPRIVIDNIEASISLTKATTNGSNYAQNICQVQNAHRVDGTGSSLASIDKRADHPVTSNGVVKVVNGSGTDLPAVRQGSKSSMISAVRNSQSSSYSARQNRSRAIRVSFSLVAAYIICWLPYNALSLIQFIDPVFFDKHTKKVYCLHGIIVFNSVINPYLYGLFGRLCRPKSSP